jgi:hypothetical protein
MNTSRRCFRPIWILAGGLSIVALLGSAAAASAVTSGGMWGRAKQVAAALNHGDAQLNSVSCASAGNCSAGGDYTDSAGHGQAFVVNRTHGVWRTAEEVPGTAALNAGGFAEVESVSCAAARTCSAGGSYSDSAGRSQAFVVNRTHGVWQTAEEVPGTAVLNEGGFAQLKSVSCGSAGNCSAGGSYSDGFGHDQAFVVNRTHGIWRTAEPVRGPAILSKRRSAVIFSVSCVSAARCSAGGSYTDSAGRSQAFVVDKTGGVWRTAREVPGTAALNQGGDAQVDSVSCASAGTCSAGGSYTDSSSHGQAFVVNRTHGAWRTAEEVPGIAILNTGIFAGIFSLSCAPVASCSAGGVYSVPSGHTRAFVVNKG